MGSQKIDLAWALSIARLIERTNRDQKRVVRPVSPRMFLRPRLVALKKTEPKRRRAS